MKWRIEIVNLTVSSTTNHSWGLTLENRIKGFSWCLHFICRLLFTLCEDAIHLLLVGAQKLNVLITLFIWIKRKETFCPARDPVVTVSVEGEGRKQVWPFFLKVVLVTHYIQEGLFPLCMSEEKWKNLTGLSGKYPRDRATYVCPPLQKSETGARIMNCLLTACVFRERGTRLKFGLPWSLVLDILLQLLLLTYVPAAQECSWFRAPAEGDFLLKKKTKNQSYYQVSFGISVDAKGTVECAAILIQILCGTFCLYYDKVFSLTFSRYNIFPYSKNKKKKQ